MKNIESKKDKSTQNYTLITGATGGLGRAFCKELIGKNNLILTGTSIEKLNKLKTELQAIDNSKEIICIACDLSSHQDRLNLLNKLTECKYTINLLINNAGFITEGSIEYAEMDTILKCIQVNCEGTIHLTKTLIDTRDKNQEMRIICITSMASNYPMPYMAIYSATKSLLKNFMISLREEYRDKNVKVLIVEPGAIATSDDMKLAIEAQGLKGKMSSIRPDIIAKKAVKKSLKHKQRYIPGFFNKITLFVSNLTPQKIKTKTISKMWRKSQKKRNIK